MTSGETPFGRGFCLRPFDDGQMFMAAHAGVDELYTSAQVQVGHRARVHLMNDEEKEEESINALARSWLAK